MILTNLPELDKIINENVKYQVTKWQGIVPDALVTDNVQKRKVKNRKN